MHQVCLNFRDDSWMGYVEATIPTSNIALYSAPAEQVTSTKDVLDGKSGVYILLRNNRSVYVGESDNLYSRLSQHLKDTSPFMHFVAITSHDNFLAKGEIRYLEGLFIERFKQNLSPGLRSCENVMSGRYELPPFRTDIMTIFFKYASELLDVIPINKILQASTNDADHKQEEDSVADASKDILDCEVSERAKAFQKIPAEYRLCLREMGILSPEDLSSVSLHEIRRCKDLGQKGFSVVCKFIDTHNVPLLPNARKANDMFDEKAAKISAWLADTDESLICARMLFEKALNQFGKPTKKDSNEIHEIMRRTVTGWKLHPNKNGKARCGSYGVQICYVRDNYHPIDEITSKLKKETDLC